MFMATLLLLPPGHPAPGRAHVFFFSRGAPSVASAVVVPALAGATSAAGAEGPALFTASTDISAIPFFAAVPADAGADAGAVVAVADPAAGEREEMTDGPDEDASAGVAAVAVTATEALYALMHATNESST